MATHVYEGMFILDTNRYGRDPGGVSQQVTDTIAEHNGEILVSRLWEERRLAYPINGQRRGTYWLTYFRADSQELAPLERKFKLNENVVRSLTIKVDPRIVDALVAHATGVGKTEETEEVAAEGEAAVEGKAADEPVAEGAEADTSTEN